MRLRFLLSQIIWLVLAVVLLASGNYFGAPVAGIIGTFLVFGLTGLVMRWGARADAPARSDNIALTIIARLFATVTLWITYLGILAFALTEIGWVTIVLAFILFIPLLASNYMLWRGQRDDKPINFSFDFEETQKRKRDRIDNVLRDLSDKDLMRLRERLADGTIDDNILYKQIVGDDGELIDYQ